MELFRSKKYRDLCRDQGCYLQIPGICCGEDDTVVPCHSPNVNHECGFVGLSQKVSDVFTVPGCRTCHDYIDNRGSVTDKNERQDYWNRGFFRWMNHLIASGKLVIK
jgi:hypothetical protein